MSTHESMGEKYQHFTKAHPYIATLGEAAVVFAAGRVMRKAGDALDIPLGNSREGNKKREAFLQEHPVLSAGLALVVAPVSEEIVFRDIPARLRERKGLGQQETRRSKLAWAGLFAAAHAGPRKVPLPQFADGLYLTQVHEKRGLGPAIAAHGLINALAAVEYIAKKKRSN